MMNEIRPFMEDQSVVTFQSGRNFSPGVRLNRDGERTVGLLFDIIPESNRGDPKDCMIALIKHCREKGPFFEANGDLYFDPIVVEIIDTPPAEAADWEETRWIEKSQGTQNVFIVDCDSLEVRRHFFMSTDILEEMRQHPEMGDVLDIEKGTPSTLWYKHPLPPETRN